MPKLPSMSSKKPVKEKIYLDTSVPSVYYDERDPFRKDLTRNWWDKELKEYEAFVSAVTLDELKQDKEPRRSLYLNLVKGFEVLELTHAFHIAFASIYKVDYLVTWNISHLANVHRKKKIKIFNTAAGVFVPAIVTPEFFQDEG